MNLKLKNNSFPQNVIHIPFLLTSRFFTLFLFSIVTTIYTSYAQSIDTLEIVRKIISTGDSGYIQSKNYYQFEQYEKLVLSINKLPQNLRDQQTAEHLGFILNHIDTTKIGNGQPSVFAIRETLSEEYREKTNNSQKTLIKAIRLSGLFNQIKTESLDAFIDETFKQVNIFDHQINLFFKRFVSPIAPDAFKFYNYEIGDSVYYKDTKCFRLLFSPKNPYSLCFSGECWIEFDSNRYIIRKSTLRITPQTNINFITNFEISQYFDPLLSGIMAKSASDIEVNVSIFKFFYQVISKNERIFSNYDTLRNKDITFSANNEVEILPDATRQPDSLWRNYDQKSAHPETTNNLRDINPENWLSQLIQILGTNYAHTNNSARTSKFDIGPVWSTISRNDVEGLRLRFGGTTTANLNKRFFLKGYGAYGTKDHLWKYSGTLTYSLTDKQFHENEYPKSNFAFNYQYDSHIPGQNYFYSDPDNFFFSFKRGNSNKMTYRREYNFSYEKEHKNGLYWKIWNNVRNEKAAGDLHFLKEEDGNIINIDSYNASELGLTLRYSFNQKFYPGRNSRFMLRNDGPVFSLYQSVGIKNLFGGEYDYYLADIAVQKRFWLSGYGHLDMIIKAGKIWGELPFPLLILPNANQTYAILPESYSLMNTLEFINDQYTSLDLSYKMYGWIFNHIPYLKTLKLREVFSFKALMGSLSEKNDPKYNPDLFLFPADSYRMGRTPYMELSLGVENIFKLIRIDYVRRLTYLNNSDIDKNGLRITVIFGF